MCSREVSKFIVQRGTTPLRGTNIKVAPLNFKSFQTADKRVHTCTMYIRVRGLADTNAIREEVNRRGAL